MGIPPLRGPLHWEPRTTKRMRRIYISILFIAAIACSCALDLPQEGEEQQEALVSPSLGDDILVDLNDKSSKKPESDHAMKKAKDILRGKIKDVLNKHRASKIHGPVHPINKRGGGAAAKGGGVPWQHGMPHHHKHKGHSSRDAYPSLHRTFDWHADAQKVKSMIKQQQQQPPRGKGHKSGAESKKAKTRHGKSSSHRRSSSSTHEPESWRNVEKSVKDAKKYIHARHRHRALSFLKEKRAKENAAKNKPLPHMVWSVKRAKEVKAKAVHKEEEANRAFDKVDSIARKGLKMHAVDPHKKRKSKKAHHEATLKEIKIKAHANIK